MTVVDRLNEIKTRIARAEVEAGRPKGSVRLIVVTKTFDSDAIRPLLEAGHRDFGENRVQESAGKWPALREAFPDLRLDLVGSLQSNKAEEAVALFDAVHAIDRPKIAEAIARAGERTGRRPTLFVQVNTGEESQKAGVAPGGVRDLLERCGELGLTIAGLMAIPPEAESPGPHFALLGKLARENGLSRLSMGMSGDFETAIAFGATDVRVGSAIMGERPPFPE
jgi:pyridoxal phosphate enzyme (YggS family)